jgi:threonine/homoserine/homoserine lactone efflux protein
MIPLQTLAAFFAASLLLALAPGPDNIFVLTQSALQGWRAGVRVTLGLCTGLVVHTAAVALGVATVVQTSALAFTALKSFGALYLLYLAWMALRAPADALPEDGAPAAGGPLYRRGIVMNVTNPKVSIFFLAFLPQFANPARGPLSLQIMILGAVFMLATVLVFGTLAFLAGSLGGRLRRSPRVQRVLNGLACAVFAALAVKLALTER